MKTKEITMGALLTALAIVIPIILGPYKVVIGPFSATLTSHVPMFLSMLISPSTALMVGIGSTLGFLLTTPLFVAARASMHIIVGYIGAIVFKKTGSMKLAFGVTAPIHAVLEALAVIPFGWNAYQVLVATGIGTAFHHTADAAIALSVIYLLNPYIRLNRAANQQ